MEHAGVNQDDMYLSTKFPNEVISLLKNKVSAYYATALLSKGLVADEALPLISDGKTAHEIIGIHNGVTPPLPCR